MLFACVRRYVFFFFYTQIGATFYQLGVRYPTPKSLQYTWNFGILLLYFICVQVMSGLFLVCYYIPETRFAFSSIEYIVRELTGGWFLRAVHVNGVTFLFFFLYAHMFRGFFFRMGTSAHIVVWITGLFMYLIVTAIGFFGYVLPWGQMSYWAATVITNLCTFFFGANVLFWIRGGFTLGTATIGRFFLLHYIGPFILLLIVLAHFFFLHLPGSSCVFSRSFGMYNILGRAHSPFLPYFISKDLFVCGVCSFFFFLFVCYTPDFFVQVENYIPAIALVTPRHIVPEWYFLFFYGSLRSCEQNFVGLFFLFFCSCFFFIFPCIECLYTSYIVQYRWWQLGCGFFLFF